MISTFNSQQKCKNSNNSFFMKVKPILYFFKAFGRFPYGITEDGILPFSLTSGATAYTAAYYLVTLYFTTKTLKLLIYETLTNSNCYTEKLEIIMLISFLAQNFILPLTYWVQSPGLVKYINMWSSYEGEFGNDCVPPRLRCLIWSICVFFLFTGAASVIFLTYNLVWRVEHAIVFWPLACSVCFTIMLWVLSHLELLRQIRKLTKRLSKLMEELPKGGLRRRALQTRRCWSLLSSLASGTGDSQGWSCIGLSASAFASFVISSYGYFTALLDFGRSEPVKWRLIIPFLFLSIYFYIMFNVSHQVTRQLGKDFFFSLLTMDFSTLDEDTMNELTLLLLYHSTNPPIIKYSGFLVIDRLLLISFITNTVTYLVVLIQIKS